ncbi:hypothetical protein MKW98_024484, partial [Papaver atlanticum]
DNDSDAKTVPKATTDKWLWGHQRSDGSVHPSAVQAHKKVTEAKQRNRERRASGRTDEYMVSEELDEVFGHNRKDGIRGYSSNASKKQAEMAAIACSALQKRDTVNEARLDSIQSEVGHLASKMAAFQGDMGSKFDALGPEKGSTSYLGGVNGRVPGIEVSASNAHATGPVELLDNGGRVVALGSIARGDIVHHKKVKPNERKVYIEQVYEQAAIIWDAPQGDGWCTLSQVPLPNWLKWAEDRLSPVA